MDKIARYAKGIVGAVGTLVTVVHAALQDQAISFDEASGIWTAVLGVLTVVGVVQVPNRDTQQRG